MDHSESHMSTARLTAINRKVLYASAIIATGTLLVYALSSGFRELMSSTFEALVEAAVLMAAYCT